VTTYREQTLPRCETEKLKGVWFGLCSWMEQALYWLRYSRNSLTFIEPESPIPCSQKPADVPYREFSPHTTPPPPTSSGSIQTHTVVLQQRGQAAEADGFADTLRINCNVYPSIYAYVSQIVIQVSRLKFTIHFVSVPCALILWGQIIKLLIMKFFHSQVISSELGPFILNTPISVFVIPSMWEAKFYTHTYRQ
jgi:hypothetical protein